MNKLKSILHEGNYSCVIANGNDVRQFSRRGVADIYDLFKQEPEFLYGAMVADKVIGKGAAALMIRCGVKHVYTDLISQSALSLFFNAGIDVDYAKCVHHIINRDHTDWCPLEKRCKDTNSIAEILIIVDSFVASMRAKIGLLSVIWLFMGLMSNAATAKRDTLNIPEVVVTGSRNEVDIRHLPMSVSVVGSKDIKSRYDQSLLPVLTEQVPGLFTTARGIMGYGVSTGSSGGMSMRGVGGSPTTGMLILIDGHPQYMGLMGHPIADAYQSMIAQKVEVVRGPASVLYGSNAMGGVINIITNKLHSDELKNNIRLGYGSYNTLNSELSSQWRHKGLSTVVNASYNRTDSHRERMDFEQFGGYAKIGYDISQNWNMYADLSLTHFNASNPGTIYKPLFDNDSHITRGVTSLSLDNNYSSTSGAIKFFYNWGRHKINDGYSEGESPLDYLFNSKDRMLGVSVFQGINLFRGNRLTLGFDYQHFGGNAWNTFDNETSTDIVDKSENEYAGYLDFRQNISSIITLDAGLRYDYHTRSGSQWIPQFGISIYPITSGELKLTTGKGFRNPTIRELYMFRPANPDLSPESLWNYEISWSQRLAKSKISYGINLFYINGKNMIQTAMVDGRPLNINTGEIRNTGIELSASYRLSTAINFSANYSWLHLKYPILAAPKHKLYLGVDYINGRWSATTSIQYINGLYTSISVTDSTLENYLLWNLRGAYQANRWLGIFVKGENLLARKYEINYGFPMPRATVMAGVNINF